MKLFSRTIPDWVMPVLVVVLSVALICTSVQLVRRKDAAARQEETRSETIQSQESEIAALNAKIAELEAAVSSQTAQLTSEGGALSSANAALDAKTQEKAALEQTVADLKKQIEDLRAQVDRLKLTAANTGSKTCYLTFDDGPSDNTLKVLDILKSANAKATFFVLGTGNLNYLAQIKAGGHSIGLHGDTHEYKTIYASESAFFANIQSLREKVKSRVGVDTVLIRFPGGSSNAVSKSICPGLMTRLVKSVPAKGYCFFDWNVSAEDATGKPITAAQMVETVKGMAKGKNSICVLMHDSASKTTTVAALPGMIVALRDMGFRFEALTPDSYSFAHSHLNN